ncbi:MAG: signal peptidase I [Treponema sp.]|nr:signal peptidase I [Treponema sp.]
MTEDKKNLIFVVCVGLAIGLVLRLFVVDVLHVSGKSMHPAIKDGDTLIVNKLAYGIVIPYGEKLLVQWKEPKAGDIVIYLYNNKIVVKRCVAIGGESLAYSDDTVYTVSVGDTKIPLTESQWRNLRGIDSVPKGYIFAVGDNYEESIDSREYGFVSVRNILGKVICR